MSTKVSNFDPVTLEVLRMRLNNIVEEMGIAMMRSSGSPVIAEAGDFNTAIFDKDGRVLAYSDYVQLHIGSGAVAIQSLLETVSLSEVSPGDSFISNDPHTSGSTHPPDVTVISPIFFEGEIIAWAQSQAHLLDVGGMTPGGFAIQAVDCYSEALRLPPGVKIYERGKPVEATKRLILNNLRVPVLFWNDVRSLVASNNTGIKRLVETINEFGKERFWTYTQMSIQLVEEVVRKRIENIPDGVYQGEEWTEHNGHVNDLYRIHCRMEVRGSEIKLDFSECSKQTEGFVNCSYGATLGSIATAIAPALAWDVPFNYGVMKPITITAPKGTIINPVVPAPVSGGHLTTGARVTRLLVKLLNQAFEKSNDEQSKRVQAQWADSWTGGITSGATDKGDYFVLFNMDGGGMGAGAQYNGDGLDCSGMMTQINNILPDVESNEMMYPILYLWRKLDTSSCGPGYFRGGQGLHFAWTLWGSDEAVQTVFAPSAQIPAEGYGGGYPGGSSQHILLRDTNVEALLKSGQLPDPHNLVSEKTEVLEINDNSYVKNSDVFQQFTAGGGGFGDPLLRPLEKVAYDVQGGLVTKETAESAYGVVFVNGTLEIDQEKTRENRRRLRSNRINKPFEDVMDMICSSNEEPEQSIMVVKALDETYHCKQCGTHLGSSSMEFAYQTESSLVERLHSLGVRVRARDVEPAIVLMEQFCPGCGCAVRASIKVG